MAVLYLFKVLRQDAANYKETKPMWSRASADWWHRKPVQHLWDQSGERTVQQFS